MPKNSLKNMYGERKTIEKKVQAIVQDRKILKENARIDILLTLIPESIEKV